MDRSLSVNFLAPYRVEVTEELISPPGEGEVLVKALVSAISPGTEMLVYRGELPAGIPVDETISSLAAEFTYPLKYGYSLLGQVQDVGSGIDPTLVGRRVFAFHPHQSLFLARLTDLILVPEGISEEQAVLLPNMETAVNFLMDGRPIIGERVVILGQGIVGLLSASLLARFPLESLVTLDRFPLRRQASLQLGVRHSLDPSEGGLDAQVAELLPSGADLVFELSGSPAALDLAIRLASFEGRIVIGSWYGVKRASVDLGGRFHRSRLQLVSSQVSTMASEYKGRWDKNRRFAAAWQMLKTTHTHDLVTHRYHILEAARAYALIDQHPEQVIQVVFTYE